MAIILFCICFSCLTLCSCENITLRDFGVNDIANILDALIKRDADETPSGETYDIYDIGEDFTGPDGNPIETGENQTEIPGTSPEDPTDTITIDVPPTEPPTEQNEQTEPETTAPIIETTRGPADGGAFIASSGATIEVKNVFSDVPDKFKAVPYPESLGMTMADSLKRSIRNLANFSSKDFSGMTFYLGTTDAMLFTPDYGGGVLSDARRYRTKLVDAECNAVITSIEKPKETILDEIQLKINAGDYFSDILCVPFNIQCELIKRGLLMNLNKIPFLNLKAEYYNASATEALTLNGNIFGLVSDLTFNPSNIYAVFYNKTLVKEYHIGNPLEMYKNGNWTHEGMLAVAKELTAAVNDLNGDSRWSIGFDKENNDLINGLFISSGNKYFLKRDYALPALNFANEKTLKLIDIISKIIAPPDESGMANYFTAGEWNQNKAFENGNVLFSILKLNVIPDISDINFDWGILPVPALSPEESRFSFTDSGAMCVSILKGARNTEACGFITNALSMASYKQLQDIYVGEQMMYRLRDVDSVKTLREIVNSVAFNQYTAFSTVPEFYVSTVGTLKDAANKKGEFKDLYVGNRNILYEFFRTTRMFDRG